MPEDRLAERLAQARRLASEARLEQLDQALAGLRADAVTEGGVPADLDVEFAVIRSAGRCSTWTGRPRPGTCCRACLGRLDDAAPTMQARFHAMSGGAAHWFGDQGHRDRRDRAGAGRCSGDTAPWTERAMATASCGLTLAYCQGSSRSRPR